MMQEINPSENIKSVTDNSDQEPHEIMNDVDQVIADFEAKAESEFVPNIENDDEYHGEDQDSEPINND